METLKFKQLMQAFLEEEGNMIMRSVTNHREARFRWQKAMESGTLTGKPFSATTVRSYVRCIDMFLEKYGDISYKALEHWLETTPIEQYAKKYDIYRSTLCYAKFLIEENCLSESFLDKAKRLKPRRHKPAKQRSLTEEQIQEVLKACQTTQERAIILLLASTGIRASECADIRVKDLDLERGILTIQCGKGGRRRRVGLLPELVEALETLVKDLDLAPNSRVFLSKRYHPLSRHGIAVRVSKVGKRVWIDVSPHDLRRSFVTINAKKGISLDMLQIACGHAFINTTRGYCQTQEDEVVESMRSWYLTFN